MFFLEAAVNAIGYVMLALLVGALMVAALLPPGAETVTPRRRLIGIACALAGAYLIAHLLSLLVQGAKLAGGAPPTPEILIRYVFRTQSGNIWLLRGTYAATLIFLTWRFVRRGNGSLVLFWLSLPLVASRSMTGHAIAVRSDTLWVVASDSVHLVATALWAGGLPFLLYSLIHTGRTPGSLTVWVSEIVKRFSRVAAVSVLVLLLTGLYQSLTHVGGLDALTATPYGNALTLKLAIFALMLLLGAINFLSTKAKLLRAAGSAFQPDLKRTIFVRIGTESVLGLSILILTGFLTVLSPAAHHEHVKATVTAANHREHGQGGHVRKTAPSAQFAESGEAKVTILTPKPGQLFAGDHVPIHFDLVKGTRGHHVHAYVDGVLVGMFQSEKGTLTGIDPGRHVLKLRVVEPDHKTELAVSDEIQFTVTAPETKENRR